MSTYFIAALVGELLLGYGVRLTYDCISGAYFSRIASRSLHGWLWLIFALLGNSIGIKLRPVFFPDKRPQPGKLTGC
ncbi:YeeE/YedE family protein [Acinetobacter sp. CS-2]|nr:YeeE/YedE family protein [Acinetobacter sp. CS-2]TCH64732.1 hypothetical protein E0409_04400 [Acinetobacter sp. ANC 4862]